MYWTAVAGQSTFIAQYWRQVMWSLSEKKKSDASSLSIHALSRQPITNKVSKGTNKEATNKIIKKKRQRQSKDKWKKLNWIKITVKNKYITGLHCYKIYIWTYDKNILTNKKYNRHKIWSMSQRLQVATVADVHWEDNFCSCARWMG